jgi:hypothetical protein
VHLFVGRREYLLILRSIAIFSTHVSNPCVHNGFLLLKTIYKASTHSVISKIKQISECKSEFKPFLLYPHLIISRVFKFKCDKYCFPNSIPCIVHQHPSLSFLGLKLGTSSPGDQPRGRDRESSPSYSTAQHLTSPQPVCCSTSTTCPVTRCECDAATLTKFQSNHLLVEFLQAHIHQIHSEASFRVMPSALRMNA